MRERGLKPPYFINYVYTSLVAPHAGAWIETFLITSTIYKNGVAPHAGAWIETFYLLSWLKFDLSLPMRERGLKRKVSP